MSSRPSLRLVTLLGVLLASVAGLSVLGGCKDKAAARRAEVGAETYFPIKIGDRTVRMQIMLLDAEKAQGLMFRQKLGADEGMLFVERFPKQLSFWMRNTLLPLDIGYLDAKGELREVHQMYPRDEKQVVSQAKDVQIALEMNQGWFAAQGVRPGAKLDLAAVKAAIEARGFSPERWGLK